MGTHSALVLNALDQANKSVPQREACSVDFYIMRYGAARKLARMLANKSPLISKLTNFCFSQCCKSAVVLRGVIATSKCVECKWHKLHSPSVVCASVSV